MADGNACSDLDPDGYGQIPVDGGKLLRGNGDQDDNKRKPIIIAYWSGAAITPAPQRPARFWERPVGKAYLDFGHLKIFFDASTPLPIIENLSYYSEKAATFYA